MSPRLSSLYLAIGALSLLACLSALAATPPKEARPTMHTMDIDGPIPCAEDGLLLGNGDLSVSVYQTPDCLVWRFGKGDVWDRRLDRSDDPKTPHIREIAHGIEVEGWKCGPYGGPVQATRGTKNPKRMKELCVGSPPSYRSRPYPCPKPVGELALHLPTDLRGLRIRQRLVIEQGIIHITCSWPSGVRLDIETFIHPEHNVLALHWTLTNWTPTTRMGGREPVAFSLYRWADPSIQEFAARFSAAYRHNTFRTMAGSKATPLPHPTTGHDAGTHFVEQTFHPEPTFPKGFRYLVAPFGQHMAISPVDMAPTGEARLRLVPRKAAAHDGWLAVAVTSSSDEGGHLAALRRIRTTLGAKPTPVLEQWAADTRQAAKTFWAKSAVRIADPLLEALWYETLHARRCTTRVGKTPPGLFLPSTVRDYSHWHGDYHTNYNYQTPFWGDYTANHLEIGDAYFTGVDFMLPIGRKLARDYYGVRGVFIQLTEYPIKALDDPLGAVPMGRMAYMTGWIANQYWWRYRYTLDKQWLRTKGYPVIRDCALFYTDFLKKGDDGLYHAFPSNQGEGGFSGNPKEYTDRTQVMRHARYCLRAAILASEALDIDPELRAQWRDRLDHCAGDSGRPPVKLKGIAGHCYAANPPEFATGRPYRPQPAEPKGKPWPPPTSGSHTWYFGQYPWMTLRRLREGLFIAERDLPVFRDIIERWRHPNGIIWGMAVANYGRAGAWTESLGAVAPLQEMMLQSWDGALRIFPAWPRDLEASFERFRAEGAFLVSAAWAKGQVTTLTIHSEKGAPCSLYAPWPTGIAVTDSRGNAVEVGADAYGRPTFATRPGSAYTVRPAR